MKESEFDLIRNLRKLPVKVRSELLDFLGARSVGEEQLNRMLEEFRSSVRERRTLAGNG